MMGGQRVEQSRATSGLGEKGRLLILQHYCQLISDRTAVPPHTTDEIAN